MAQPRFLFVSLTGLITDIAWQVAKEGHGVKYYIRAEHERDIGDGFVPKVDDWKAHVDWADVIVFDDVGFGATCEELRQRGKAVVGGTTYGDRLESDRDFGQAEMKAAGMTVLPSWDTNRYLRALPFIFSIALC